MEIVELTFAGRDARLSGTLWVPGRTQRTAGVVLVGGSGPTDRLNGGYFGALRDSLVAAGATVLAYDKRGVGRSAGSWPSAGVAELAGDAAAAVTALRGQSGIDPDAVALLGHSEGGWVALRACADGAAVRRLVLNSCPAVSFIDAEVHALTVAGVPAESARAVYEELREAAHAGVDQATANRLLTGNDDPTLRQVLQRTGFRLTDDTWTQLRAWIDYAPGPDLDRLRTPTLAVYGADDPLTPVRDSADRMSQHAPAARCRVFAGADHRLFTGTTPAPHYLDVVVDWLTSTASPVTGPGH